MADVMRWRYGETNPVMLPVLVGTTIEIGDMVYFDGTSLLPAASQADGGALADNQEDFHAVFAGVAMQRHRATTDPAGSIRVATTGVFEFDCASATFKVGDLVGPAGTGSGGNVGLANQTVAAVASEWLATGKVAKAGTSVTSVLVDIKGTLTQGGVQEPSTSGA